MASISNYFRSGPEDSSISTMESGTKKESLIIRFYDPNTKSPDYHGRTLEDILSWPDRRLESSHDYIQILFPLPEGSPYNWAAPVIDRGVLEAFIERPELRTRLRMVLVRILNFYGFEVVSEPKSKELKEAKELAKTKEEIKEEQETDGESQLDSVHNEANDVEAFIIIRAAHFPQASRNWAVRFDHNHLRITRILRCLRVLGLQTECKAFYSALKDVFNDPSIHINERSMNYWRKAVRQPLFIAPDGARIMWLKRWENEETAAGKEQEEESSEEDVVSK